VSYFKWGILAAIAAAVISIGLGLLSGVGILHVFLRALIFGLVFFGFGFGLRFLINHYFPELLFMDEGTSAQNFPDQPGSMVNITMDNTGEYAVPELYKSPGNPDELGNIEDLVSGSFRPRSASPGIDRMKEESYNNDNTFQSASGEDNFSFLESVDFDEPMAESPRTESPRVDKPAVEKPGAEKPIFTPSFGEDTGVGGLPDLEMFAMAFSSGGQQPRAAAQPMAPAGLPEQTQDEFEPTKPSRYVASKPTPMKGDFNPKDLAKGISTVLRKDNK